MFPRRCVEVSRFQSLLDQRFGSAGEDPRPPPATVNEEGCVRRAIKNLSERIPLLCGLLGQLMPVIPKGDIGSFWRALRKLGPLEPTLALLAENFNTSLLASYRSLIWQREKCPA